MPARPHAAFHGLRRRVKQSAAGAISGGAFSFFVTAKSFRFSRNRFDFHIATFRLFPVVPRAFQSRAPKRRERRRR